ncbi:MAG: 2-hydroxychromene-2-carboxylate isomerase [Rhodospirillaceae bacterium]|jgi:2-hydroxychromene-2-carboxylate isomerase|nr:2-hydroxychromene-2-carboxylate isomerase [Rhodospirillaceae bacterium]
MPRTADWYIDFISPYPYLQLASFDRFPSDLVIQPRPVLFPALLKHWENKGPAEIPAKRSQTYRYCHWLAGKRGIPFKAPPRHPFNPLPLLRLAVALDGELDAMRAMFDHVWGKGRDADDPKTIEALASSLGIDDAATRINDQKVKDQLRANTDEAIARGVFGVPTFVINDEIFWGDDITDMLLDYLDNPDLFATGELGRLGDLPVGVERKESRL